MKELVKKNPINISALAFDIVELCSPQFVHINEMFIEHRRNVYLLKWPWNHIEARATMKTFPIARNRAMKLLAKVNAICQSVQFIGFCASWLCFITMLDSCKFYSPLSTEMKLESKLAIELCKKLCHMSYKAKNGCIGSW